MYVHIRTSILSQIGYEKIFGEFYLNIYINKYIYIYISCKKKQLQMLGQSQKSHALILLIMQIVLSQNTILK